VTGRVKTRCLQSSTSIFLPSGRAFGRHRKRRRARTGRSRRPFWQIRSLSSRPAETYSISARPPRFQGDWRTRRNVDPVAARLNVRHVPLMKSEGCRPPPDAIALGGGVEPAVDVRVGRAFEARRRWRPCAPSTPRQSPPHCRRTSRPLASTSPAIPA